jgi:tetratricopeptide (TPR) repeat protein
VQSVIRRRLARLSPAAHELVGLAATIGREFTLPLLKAAGQFEGDSLVRGLDELCQHLIVHEQGAHAYDFSHGKIREVAYASLGNARRQMWHQRIAQALESTGVANLDALHGQIATHYERAGLAEHAITHYRRAGEVSQRLYALPEALKHFRKVLALLQQRPHTLDRSRAELDIHLVLGPLFIATEGHDHPLVREAYLRARELAGQVGDTPRLLGALCGLQYWHLGAGKLATARALGEELLGLAQAQPGSDIFPEAYCGLGWTLMFMGELALAQAHLQRGAELWSSGLLTSANPSQFPSPYSWRASIRA